MKTFQLCAIFFCLFVTSSACSVLLPISAEQRLLEANIDQNYFSSLSGCEQIRIFAQIGQYYVDRGHSYVNVPDWMDNEIASSPRDIVAKCIAEEGIRLSELMSRFPERNEQISLSIHALIYKAEALEVLDDLNVDNFLHEVICSRSLSLPRIPSLIYYRNQFGDSPGYLYEPDATERMIGELCE